MILNSVHETAIQRLYCSVGPAHRLSNSPLRWNNFSGWHRECRAQTGQQRKHSYRNRGPQCPSCTPGRQDQDDLKTAQHNNNSSLSQAAKTSPQTRAPETFMQAIRRRASCFTSQPYNAPIHIYFFTFFNPIARCQILAAYSIY